MNPTPVIKKSKLMKIVFQSGKIRIMVATKYITDTGTYWKYTHNGKSALEKSRFGPKVFAKMFQNNHSPSYSPK